MYTRLEVEFLCVRGPGSSNAKMFICAMVKPVAFCWGWETSNL